jgi:hypothetical protein
MKLPYATVSKVLFDNIYTTYMQIRVAQSPDSEGGRKVTRNEIWDLVTNFIINCGMRMEEIISNSNNLNYSYKYRWLVLTIIVKSLKELPEEFEKAKADDSRIDKKEAMEIVANILKKSIPEILDLTEDQL